MMSTLPSSVTAGYRDVGVSSRPYAVKVHVAEQADRAQVGGSRRARHRQ